MDIKYLNQGSSPSLLDLLDRREERQEIIKGFDTKHEGKSLLVFTLNIPGPVKNNDKIRELFILGKEKIEKSLKDMDLKILCKEEYSLTTGPELYLFIDVEGEFLKRQMIDIENTKLGRLFDIDVVKNGKYITRKDLGIEERKCFLCDKPAKVCARSRAHSIEDMLKYIERIMDQYL